MIGDKDDKTERATPRKRDDARKKGNNSLSAELTMSILILVAVLTLQAIGTGFVGSLAYVVAQGLDLSRRAPMSTPRAHEHIVHTLGHVAPWVIVFMLGLVAAALASCYAQVGFRWTPAKIAFNFGKLNPIQGLKRVFGPAGVFRLFNSLLKLTALGIVLFLVVRSRREELALLIDMPFMAAAGIVADIVLSVFWWTACSLIVISLGDVVYQRFRFERDIKMSKNEIDDERKNTEGDPRVRIRIRTAQREISKRRMMNEVPKADVVITNPTHYAVALRYRRDAMHAPTIVAKGTDRMALRIRQLARQHSVYIMEDPPLARALFRGTRLGQEIPARFYQAVATVLSHVYRLRGRNAS